MRRRKRESPDRKMLQLCRAVERTLNAVLGECGDEVLRDLWVLGVEPWPSSARLLVSVGLNAAAEARDPVQLLASLHRAQGLLRSEVAAAVNRRKTPELLFRLGAPIVT